MSKKTTARKAWPATKVEMRKLDDLVPYARNSRTHSPEQVKQIQASMREWGDWRFCAENDCYVVTALGDVYRVCRRQRSKSGRLVEKYETAFLKGSLDRDGYKTYRMVVDGVKKHVKGHRLVLNAFVGVSPDKVANHISGVKVDNSINNLEWPTVAENNTHAIATGLVDNKKPNLKNTKIHKYDYATIYSMHKHLGFKRAELAKANMVSRQTIDKVINFGDDLMREAFTGNQATLEATGQTFNETRGDRHG